MQIRKGQRLPLAQLLPADLPNGRFEVQLRLEGLKSDVDFSCFGLDSRQKLSDDRYMTFFNQPQTPCGSVSVLLNANQVCGFAFALSSLPAAIDRLVITTAIDGSETMGQMQSGFLRFMGLNRQLAEFAFEGKDFQDEKALILGEFYRKEGEWRFSATGQGFNGGLAALVKHYGGELSEEAVPAPNPTPLKLTLEKKVAGVAPKLVDLAKKASLSLEKKKLSNVVARVGLVLDASGSMRLQYTLGRVQEVINRILPLAVHFDDDGELDIWAFSSKSLALPPVTLNNYADYIDQANNGWKKWGMLSVNNEPAVIEAVLAHYKETKIPALIIFISDGGVSQDKKIKKLLTDAASLPIFWQFVGIGGRNYGILEKLDTMSGRIIDNCGFFALDDLDSVSEQELYDRLLNEFPGWLLDARAKGVLR